MKNQKLSKNQKIAYLVTILGIFLILLVSLNIFLSRNQKSQSLTDKEEKFLQKMSQDLKEFKTTEPENISEDNIFYPVHETKITEKLLEKSIRKTSLEENAKFFIKAEDKYGINAIFLLAIANHESAYGTSRIAQDKNNLFGFNAVDSDPYNKASDFKDLNEGILEVGKMIKKLYLEEDGRYFNGYSAEAIGKNYSSDPNWAVKVNGHMVEIAEKILDYYGIDY